MVFYAYDLEAYRDTLRGFYLDYLSDLPGPVVRTEDELYAALRDLPGVAAAYGERYDAFLERFAPRDDGRAAERVVDAVFIDAISSGAVPPAPAGDEPSEPEQVREGSTVAGTTPLATPVGAETTIDEQVPTDDTEASELSA
jgi:hypothetical protein